MLVEQLDPGLIDKRPGKNNCLLLKDVPVQAGQVDKLARLKAKHNNIKTDVLNVLDELVSHIHHKKANTLDAAELVNEKIKFLLKIKIALLNSADFEFDMALFYLLLSVSKLETNLAQQSTKTWAEWVQKQTGIQLTGTYSYHRIDALFKSKGFLFSNNKEEDQLRQQQIEFCFKQNFSPRAIIAYFQLSKKMVLVGLNR